MDYDFSEILVYLYDSQTHIRKDIRAALTGYGFSMIEDVRTYDELVEKMDAQEQPDLIICDADADDGRVIELMGTIRRNDYGDNPFIVCIMTTWKPTPERVKAITNSGVDDLLGKPISPKQLMDRIRIHISSRKPFIVTADYIGPDRRKASSRPSSAKTFDVPNTMAMRAKRQEVPDLGEAIHQSWTSINNERQSRNAFQLAFLVDLIVPALLARTIDQETAGLINKLVDTCLDSSKRLKTDNVGGAADLFKRMTVVAKAIQANPLDPGQKNIDLLKPLAMAINKAMNPGKDEKKLTAEITGALDKYAKKKVAG